MKTSYSLGYLLDTRDDSEDAEQAREKQHQKLKEILRNPFSFWEEISTVGRITVSALRLVDWRQNGRYILS